MKKYKLKFYRTNGYNRGSVHHEEYFETLGQLDARYKEVFIKFSAFNPTAWEFKGVDWYSPFEWYRIMGY